MTWYYYYDMVPEWDTCLIVPTCGLENNSIRPKWQCDVAM